MLLELCQHKERSYPDEDAQVLQCKGQQAALQVSALDHLVDGVVQLRDHVDQGDVQEHAAGKAEDVLEKEKNDTSLILRLCWGVTKIFLPYWV